MEKLLARMARQLDSLDETSLMNLWSKYATLASRFEPTQRWEENVLIFSLIQAKHWKNQLFNYNLARMSKPFSGDTDLMENLSFGFSLEDSNKDEVSSHCSVIAFQPGAREGNKSRDSEKKGVDGETDEDTNE